MKKNACLLVSFLAILCMSGQTPRKEMHSVTTVEEPKKLELKVENEILESQSIEIEKENIRISAAQKAREHIPGQVVEVPKSAAQKAIEAEIAILEGN